MPKGASDELPRTKAGLLLSLAERLDNLTGFFGIGLRPSGSADPYALRRQAAGLARLVVESGKPVSLGALVSAAVEGYAGGASLAPDTAAAVAAFVLDRVRQGFLDQGYRYDLVDAAIGAGADDLADLRRRLDATVALSKEASFQDLVELVERTFNISKALAKPRALDRALLKEPAETALFDAWAGAKADVAGAVAAKEYAKVAHVYLERLRAPVHEFMAKVFVNVDDAAVKENRLSLLQEIWGGFGRNVADLSKVVEGKKPVEARK